MNRDAFERKLVRRLLDHIEQGTTDMAEAEMEVPAEFYTSREHLERELQHLFFGQPLVLCLSGALPRPGTYLALDLCGVPVLVTRDGHGAPHAFLNACRHRGVRIADGAGEARRITCPFHAWTYDVSGALVGVPRSEGFPTVARGTTRLVELPVAEGHGLVVGRLRPGPPIDIGEFLGPELAEELDMLGFAHWQPHGALHVHRVAANWKVTLDTFRENYHFDYLHRKTLAGYAYGNVLTFDPLGRHLRNCSALRSIDELRRRPEHEWKDVSRHFSYQYQLFPNTALTFDWRHIELWQIVPIDERSSEVLHTAYYRPDLPEDERARLAEMAPWICQAVVDAEDFWVASRTEPGIRSGLLESVVFGRNEPALQHIHKVFFDVLGITTARTERGGDEE